MVTSKRKDSKNHKKQPEFPFLGMHKDDDLIVLFVEGEGNSVDEGVGTVVWSEDEDYEEGHYSEDWHLPDFSEYYGEITLKGN